MSHDKSLNFLIYAFYAVLLWCMYLGFTRIYFNLLEDLLNSPIQYGFFGIGMAYGQAATLVLISAIGLCVTRYFSLRLSKSGSVSLDAGSRMWMLRLILLVASLSAISDIYILITAFMVGSGTAVELYEALITLVVAFGILAFCLLELRLKTMSHIRLFSVSSCLFLLVAGATFASAFYMAPPWVMRLVQEDRKTFDKMNIIANKIDQYYTKRKSIPDNLTLLEEYINKDELIDPQTGNLFDYKAIDKRTYEICAVLRSDKSQVPRRQERFYGRFEKFDYQKGKACFKLQAHQY